MRWFPSFWGIWETKFLKGSKVFQEWDSFWVSGFLRKPRFQRVPRSFRNNSSQKLTKDNWMSWKREMMTTARDRGLYDIITGMDKLPVMTNKFITVATAGVSMVGNTPLLQLQEEWSDRNNAAYSQILLCISPKLQISLGSMECSQEKVWIERSKQNQYH